MSGVTKTLGKVFKPVLKTAKKIAPVALAAGAIFFTAGAALGMTPTLGGAVEGLLGRIGLGADSTIGRVLAGSITQAGYGAAIGGATGLITGKPLQGAQIGALGGAITGGVSGAAGWETDPLRNTFKSTGARGFGGEDYIDGQVKLAGGDGTDTLGTGQFDQTDDRMGGGLDARGSGARTMTGQGVNEVGAKGAGTKPRGFEIPSFLNSNLGAGLVAGSASGLLQGMAAGDQAQALQARDDAQRTAWRQNYASTGTGLIDPAQAAQARQAAGTSGGIQPRGFGVANFGVEPAAPTPQPAQPAQGGRYRWNAQSRSIELVTS